MTSALPNIHPILVHFPIVLLPLALVLDLLWPFARTPSANRLAAGAWLLAALAVTAAFLAGQVAADSLIDVPPSAQSALNAHADWATRVLWLAWPVAAARLLAAWWPKRRWSMALRAAAIVSGVLLVGVVVWTADLGGALVYQHGLAVHTTPVAIEKPTEAPPAPTDQVHQAGALMVGQSDGRWVWNPTRADAGTLGLESWPSTGASFIVDGSHTLSFEPEVGDVQLNVWLDLSGFEGEMRLLHHMKGASAGALVLVVGPGGDVAKLMADSTELDAAEVELSARHAVAVSASGGHFKGMIDGRTVVHGHSAALDGGRSGIRFDGRGHIGIERVEIVPLTGN